MMQEKAALTRLASDFEGAGVVVRMLECMHATPDCLRAEIARLRPAREQFVSASLLHSSVAVSVVKHRVGLVVKPSSRGCGWPHDAFSILPWPSPPLERPPPACELTGEDFAAKYATQIERLCRAYGRFMAAQRAATKQRDVCCQLDWSAALAVKRNLSASPSGCARAIGNGHIEVFVKFSASDVSTLVYAVAPSEMRDASRALVNISRQADALQQALRDLGAEAAEVPLVQLALDDPQAHRRLGGARPSPFSLLGARAHHGSSSRTHDDVHDEHTADA